MAASQFLFLIGRFLKIFCSETTGPVKQHFIGFPHFIPIGQKHGHHGQFLFLIG